MLHMCCHPWGMFALQEPFLLSLGTANTGRLNCEQQCRLCATNLCWVRTDTPSAISSSTYSQHVHLHPFAENLRSDYILTTLASLQGFSCGLALFVLQQAGICDVRNTKKQLAGIWTESHAGNLPKKVNLLRPASAEL